MKKQSILFLIVILTVFSLVLSARPCLADDLSRGKAAEKAGNFRQALTYYVNALRANKGSQHQLREKIIKLALKLDSLPDVPESYYRHMARGEVFVESARDKKGYARAAGEFAEASNKAPWRSEVYYNLGIVQDKAGQYDQAIQSLKFYLLAAPNASDSREVRTMIYKIEARKEAQQSKAVAAVSKKPKYPTPSDLEGEWSGSGTWKPGHVDKYWISVVGREIEFDFNPYHTGKCSKPCLTLYLKGYDLVGHQRTHGGYFPKPRNATILCNGPITLNNLEIKGRVNENLNGIRIWWRQPFLTHGCKKVYEDYQLFLNR